MPRSRKKHLAFLGWNDEEVREKLEVKVEPKKKKVKKVIPEKSKVVVKDKVETKVEKKGFW